MSDISIKVTDRNGQEHHIHAPTDMAMNLMEIIRSYELAEEGTLGVCGGLAMCASCQVYVKSGLENLPEMQPEEDAMLSETFTRQDNSRLSCQLNIFPEMEGLEIEIAPAE